MKQPAEKTKAPQDRDKALSVAYLRLTGDTQEQAAKATGVSRMTVQRWESTDWWPEIVAEASRRWLSGLEAKARKVLHDGLDPALSLKVLERRMPELAPATQKVDQTSGGEPCLLYTSDAADEVVPV